MLKVVPNNFNRALTAALIVAVLFFCILWPTLRSNQLFALSSECSRNMRGLSQALLVYTEDWDQTLPRQRDVALIDRSAKVPGFVRG